MTAASASALRPAPEKGETIAAAVVALTLLVLALNGRFEAEWDVGIHLVYSALAAVAVVAMAAGSPRTGERPAGWQSILFIAAFVLALFALGNLADVLGADDPPFGASATVVWIGLLLVALMAWFATSFNSGISTLLYAVTLAVVILAFIDWVFDPEKVDTFRWILLLIAAGFFAVGAMRHSSDPHHATGFVNTAGLALIGLAFTFVGNLIVASPDAFGGGSPDAGVGWGWELAVLVGGAALVAYSVTAGTAGPGYLGAANLGLFAILSFGPGEDGPSLIGWPLILILLTAGLFVLGRGSGGSGTGVTARPAPDAGGTPAAAPPGS